MLLRYNPPRAERSIEQGVYGSVVGRYRQSRRRKDAAGRSQDQPGKGQPAEPGGNDEEEKREATRRNGYEEIPPPVIPP